MVCINKDFHLNLWKEKYWIKYIFDFISHVIIDLIHILYNMSYICINYTDQQ